MKYYPASFLIFRLICIVVIFQTNLTFAQNMNVYKTWIDDNGKHSLVIEKGITKNSTGEHLSVKQVTGRNIDWVLNDYVNDC
jgi:cell division protein YceG involved in septum cleavage